MGEGRSPGRRPPGSADGQPAREGPPPLIVHRSGRIAAARHPVLLPPRTRIEETVVDFTQCAATFDEAFGSLSQACGSRLCTASMICGALERRQTVRYRAELQAALGEVAGGALSPLEYRYVHGVERPHGPARRTAPGATDSGPAAPLPGQSLPGLSARSGTGWECRAPGGGALARHPPGQLAGQAGGADPAVQLVGRDQPELSWRPRSQRSWPSAGGLARSPRSPGCPATPS